MMLIMSMKMVNSKPTVCRTEVKQVFLNLNKESLLTMSKLTNLAIRSHAIHSTHPSILEFKHIVLVYGCQSTEYICLWKNL